MLCGRVETFPTLWHPLCHASHCSYMILRLLCNGCLSSYQQHIWSLRPPPAAVWPWACSCGIFIPLRLWLLSCSEDSISSTLEPPPFFLYILSIYFPGSFFPYMVRGKPHLSPWRKGSPDSHRRNCSALTLIPIVTKAHQVPAYNPGPFSFF